MSDAPDAPSKCDPLLAGVRALVFVRKLSPVDTYTSSILSCIPPPLRETVQAFDSGWTEPDRSPKKLDSNIIYFALSRLVAVV